MKLIAGIMEVSTSRADHYKYIHAHILPHVFNNSIGRSCTTIGRAIAQLNTVSPTFLRLEGRLYIIDNNFESHGYLRKITIDFLSMKYPCKLNVSAFNENSNPVFA